MCSFFWNSVYDVNRAEMLSTHGSLQVYWVFWKTQHTRNYSLVLTYANATVHSRVFLEIYRTQLWEQFIGSENYILKQTYFF